MMVRTSTDRAPTRRRIGLALATACAASLSLAAASATVPAAAQQSDTAGTATGKRNTAVTDWNAAAGRAAVAACIAPVDNPLTESRMYAMTQIAVHDALNAIDRRSEPYAADFRAPRGASVNAAVAAAAHDVLVAVFSAFPEPFGQTCGDKGVESVESAYTAALARVPQGVSKSEGLAAGHRAARAVIALRTGDGSLTPLIVPDFPQGTRPGQWRFTLDRPFAYAPGWGSVRPFALRNADQLRSDPPRALTSVAYARDLNQVKALGGDGAPTRRTAAQTETALFWLESSPLAWNRIARTLAATSHLDPWEQARLLGLLNVALADGYIGSFAQKFDQLFWRPETAIRLANTDGNPATTADPDWKPLVTTPPIPDHDSAHAVEGGAASMVFRQFFGTDRYVFTQCSNTLPANTCATSQPTTHRFTSFSQAADENSISRVLIGFHFRWATTQGQEHGEDIGRYVVSSVMEQVQR